ncbi:hypothetical protein [Yinghuangia soli]|uniref:Uncharacterized protein n=1 Tax=Yinghuangia soli TaxID=2908204 RepID=A0AA41PXE4_9ACTN|nr:hypothetical protein [Yinghuangia soli]MCF2526971.1 hypothetical protein [Yinghuangia soli]
MLVGRQRRGAGCRGRLVGADNSDYQFVGPRTHRAAGTGADPYAGSGADDRLGVRPAYDQVPVHALRATLGSPAEHRRHPDELVPPNAAVLTISGAGFTPGIRVRISLFDRALCPLAESGGLKDVSVGADGTFRDVRLSVKTADRRPGTVYVIVSELEPRGMLQPLECARQPIRIADA